MNSPLVNTVNNPSTRSLTAEAFVADSAYQRVMQFPMLHCLLFVFCLVICQHFAWGAPVRHPEIDGQPSALSSQVAQFSLFSAGLNGGRIDGKDGPLEIICLTCGVGVLEGDKCGLLGNCNLLFEVKNLSQVWQHINLTISENFTTSPTTGDADDWAKGLASTGCDGVLKSGQVCFIKLHFYTDRKDDPPGTDFGDTTFTEKVVAHDGAGHLYAAIADSTVSVEDCGPGNGICSASTPEPSNLGTLGAGVLGLFGFLRKRLFNSC